jgi:tetratricopeptide (TPR) repeat protein
MLQGYKDGLSTDQVFQKTLNVDIKAFDKKFDDYIRARFAGVLPALSADPPDITTHMSNDELLAAAAKAPNDFGVQLLVGMALLGHDKIDDALPMIEKARAMFPEYGGDDSPYALLAAAYEKKGDTAKETAALKQWTSLTETNMKALVKLADLLQAQGDAAGAADALNRAIFINPFDLDMHRRLADLAHTAGDKQRTIRERAAVVALGPVDKADALYQLALAQHEAGDDTAARSSVLRSLEEAPNYEKAQTLLLTIVDARGARSPEKTP